MNSLPRGLFVAPLVLLCAGYYFEGSAHVSGLIQIFFHGECLLPAMTLLTIALFGYLFNRQTPPLDLVWFVVAWWALIIGSFLAGVPLTIPEGTTIHFLAGFVKPFYQTTSLSDHADL